MDRRSFLLKSTLAGSAILTRPKAFQSIGFGVKKPGSVLIIGAGFAGLAAGYKLKKAGVKVTILEARNRIGGRVFSHSPTNGDGQTIELGAEWVGASHERIIDLCKIFGLKLFNNQFESDLVWNGEHSSAGNWGYGAKMDEFWNQKTAIWEKMTTIQKRKLDKMDWWRYLSNMGLDDKDLLLRELLDSTDFGESIRHTSAYAAFAEYAESSEKNEMDLKIEGGNALLSQKLAEAIGLENIKLETNVISVDQMKTKTVTITTENGTKYTADKIICAIPTMSILKIQWKPGLPLQMKDAIHQLQYARIGKFPILFTERFWGREDFDMITDTPAHYFYHGTKSQLKKSGVLTCYATGDKAEVLASVSKEQRLEIILNALKPAFGNIQKYIKEDMIYYWGKDKYSAGAYAFYGKNQWFEVMPILKKPHVHCQFAGEHLADWQGFMEGAIQSGEDAVDQIYLT